MSGSRFLSGGSESASLSEAMAPRTSGPRVDGCSDQQEDALKPVLPLLGQVQEGRRVEDLFDQQGPEEGTDERAAAAEETRAPKDNSGDTTERIGDALRWVADPKLRHKHDSTKERERGTQNVCAEDYPIYPD